VDGKCSVNAADVTHVTTLSSTYTLHSVWFIKTAKRKFYIMLTRSVKKFS